MVSVYKPDGSLKPVAATFYRTFACTLDYYNQHKEEIPEGTLVYITDDVQEKYLQLLDQVYPVGTVYQNVTDFRTPTEILGFGQWQRIVSKYLYGSSSNVDDAFLVGSDTYYDKDLHTKTKPEGTETRGGSLGQIVNYSDVWFVKDNGEWYVVSALASNMIKHSTDPVTDTTLIDTLENETGLNVYYCIFTSEGNVGGDELGANDKNITVAQLPQHRHGNNHQHYIQHYHVHNHVHGVGSYNVFGNERGGHAIYQSGSPHHVSGMFPNNVPTGWYYGVDGNRYITRDGCWEAPDSQGPSPRFLKYSDGTVTFGDYAMASGIKLNAYNGHGFSGNSDSPNNWDTNVITPYLWSGDSNWTPIQGTVLSNGYRIPDIYTGYTGENKTFNVQPASLVVNMWYRIA